MRGTSGATLKRALVLDGRRSAPPPIPHTARSRKHQRSKLAHATRRNISQVRGSNEGEATVAGGINKRAKRAHNYKCVSTLRGSGRLIPHESPRLSCYIMVHVGVLRESLHSQSERRWWWWWGDNLSGKLTS